MCVVCCSVFGGCRLLSCVVGVLCVLFAASYCFFGCVLLVARWLVDCSVLFVGYDLPCSSLCVACCWFVLCLLDVVVCCLMFVACCFI